MSESLSAELAQRVRCVILDVDGVMTDGGIYTGMTERGEPVELKRFEITDGLGAKMLVWAGLHVYILSGRHSQANQRRADELSIEYHEAPGGYKRAVADRLVEKAGCDWSEVACLCDDLADLPMLEAAGLPVAVANAVPEVRAVARWVTMRHGGRGAVREFSEALLRARGQWNALVAQYHKDRSKPAPAENVDARA